MTLESVDDSATFLAASHGHPHGRSLRQVKAL